MTEPSKTPPASPTTGPTPTPGATWPAIDGYVLEAFVATGGMGHVFRARDAVTGAQVAIKVLAATGLGDPRSRAVLVERFTREARVLSRLTNAGVARYHSHGLTREGVPYVCVEWVAGETLGRLLERGALSVGETVTLGIRLGRALGAAHRLGIVHRDVKPGNVMLEAGDVARAKLIDFGIAREPTSHMTTHGIAIGTHGYMSPEQARGAADVGPAADVFSLGCVLFRCLCERLPFEGPDGLSLMGRILFEDAPDPTDFRVGIPDKLVALLRRMLAKDPAARPEDGDAVARELAALDLANMEVPSVPRASRTGLTRAEQQLVHVLAAGPFSDDARGRVTDLLAPHQARVEWLASGVLLALFTPEGPTTDRVRSAARAAITLRDEAGAGRVALATGRAEVTSRLPVGEAFSAAVSLLEATAPESIRLDEVTAALLETRFDLARDAVVISLVREKRDPQTARSLLGKPTPLVGRDRELALLRGIIDESREEPIARAVLVVAPPGRGKSRLRAELLAGLEGATSWIARGDPLSAGSPFGMARQLVRAAVQGEDLRAFLAARLEPDEALRAADFLGELLGRPSAEESPALRAARNDPVLMRDQIQRAWEDLLLSATRDEQVVLVLEDLHWGDAPSARLVDGALLRLRDRPLFVLALARPEIDDVLPGLWVGRGLHKMELGALGRSASAKLARGLLGDDAPKELVDRIVQMADGNAFHLEELVRATIERGLDSMPATVVAMLHVRLGALDADARLALRAASVFGNSFRLQGVTALLGKKAQLADVRDRFAQLLALEFVHRGAEPDEMSFRHPLLREAAYAMLTEADRRAGHRLAGRWLEQQTDAAPLVVAEHFERGGEPARAARYYAIAAEQSLEGGDLANALARAERAVASGAGGEDLGRLGLVQAQALRWRGEFGEASKRAEDAMTRLRVGSALWFRAAGERGWAMGILGDVDGIVELAETLLTTDALPADAPARAVALAQLVPQLVRVGRVELADLVLGSIRSECANDAYARAHLHHALAARRTYAGDPLAYLEEMPAAAAASDSVGDGRGACLARAHLGYGHAAVGDFEEAERVLWSALAEAEQKGLDVAAASAKSNLGFALALQGRLSEGRRYESEAAEAGARQKNARFEAAARLYLARIDLMLGDLEAAEREARLAVELPPKGAPLIGWARAALSEVLLRRGRVDEALALAREGASLFRARGGVLEGEATVHLALARALIAAGETDEARAALARAKERLLQRANAIRDPLVRARFLERLPENRETLELAREHGIT
jgi:tetratricopeptide (TPR) repeat protein